MAKYRAALVIGTRPDVIRASKLIKLLDAHPLIDLTFIHSGQHYDKELWGNFLEQLNIRQPDVILNTGGVSACQQHARLIEQLEPVLQKLTPDVCLFLGDTNTVIGSIVPLRLNIPIAHIEGAMRSYDWNMIEERNRVLIDHISDVLYVYQDDYRLQAVQEGISPDKICVVGNIIVDVLEEYKNKFWWPSQTWKHMCVYPPLQNLPYKIENVDLFYKEFALMTLHRNEHMNNKELAQHLIDEVGKETKVRDLPVVLIEMPRLAQLKLNYPSHFIPTKPLGFFEFAILEKGAAIEYTDSGTNQEAASIFGTPCVVLRTNTERPECRDCGTTFLAGYEFVEEATEKALTGRRNPNFSLGDGKSSERIVGDLVDRLTYGFVSDKWDFKGAHTKWL